MARQSFLTKEGRNKLISELENLKKRKPQLQDEIARAREHGDLKENAEYHAAKESLTNLMRRINELESKIAGSKLLDDQNIDKSKVYIGATVKIKDLDDGDESEYTIVDVEEANPAERKISVQSPLAQGMLGHKKGETVKIELPRGQMTVKILDIKR